MAQRYQSMIVKVVPEVMPIQGFLANPGMDSLPKEILLHSARALTYRMLETTDGTSVLERCAMRWGDTYSYKVRTPEQKKPYADRAFIVLFSPIDVRQHRSGTVTRIHLSGKSAQLRGEDGSPYHISCRNILNPRLLRAGVNIRFVPEEPGSEWGGANAYLLDPLAESHGALRPIMEGEGVVMLEGEATATVHLTGDQQVYLDNAVVEGGPARQGDLLWCRYFERSKPGATRPRIAISATVLRSAAAPSLEEVLR